jgi:fibronectin type 3 domain-containing protein
VVKALHKALFAAVVVALVASAAQALAADVSLAWDPNTESDLAGYRIYRGMSSGNYDKVVDVGNVTTWTDTTLEVGQTYYFAATAYDTEGLESTFSNEVSYTAPGPKPTKRKGFLTNEDYGLDSRTFGN